MSKAVIYARVSSEGERQNTDRQVADLRAYADSAGIEVVRVFEERISGAVRNNERPVLSECLAFCCSEHPDMLLVSEISRLGRNTVEILKAIDELSGEKVNVFIQNVGLNTLQPDGRRDPIAMIVIPVMGEVARIERENIMYRLNSGRQLAIERGVKMGRKVGYRLSNREIVAKYPKVVRKLKEGFSVRETAAVCGVSPSTVQKVNKAIKVLKG